MLQNLNYRAIGMGVLINFGGYAAISLILNVSIMIFDSLFKSVGIPFEIVVDTLIGSLFIASTLNFICCAIMLFGTYQCCRMARAYEWRNGLMTLTISCVLLLLFGGNCSFKEVVIWNGIGISMSIFGIYLAVIKNRKELSEEKVS